MSELASLRAEVKQWEREFRATQGRDPEVDDIRKLPEIARKYKAYKQLLKAVKNPQNTVKSAATSSRTPQPPVTPPRNPKPSATHLLSAKRVIETTAPLSTFNPFSPQKVKVPRNSDATTKQASRPLPNPFASPAKPAQRIEQPIFQTVTFKDRSENSTSQIEPPNTISRARKRLRGEPVSPSPNKDKRRRRASPTTIIPFPKMTLDGRGSDEDEDDNVAANSSFVDDSPMKIASSARSFTVLFDENPLPSADIFGLSQKASKTRGNVPSKQEHDLKASKGLKTSKSKTGIFPITNIKQQSMAQYLSQPPTTAAASSNSNKRSSEFSRTPSPVPHNESTSRSSHARSKSPLLPPSPPPTSTSSTYNGKGKGKRKANAKSLDGRKKARLGLNEPSDDEATSDGLDFPTHVRVIAPRVVEARSDDEIELDFNPSSMYSFNGTNHESHKLSSVDQDPSAIDLPQKLRDVLALNPKDTRIADIEEDKVFKNLVYGRRVGHYDPKKGEIWDVGEDELGDDEGGNRGLEDDEWEGEPVPWEAAEL
ncbi:hypothetical protein FA15DRAFT_651313 [Coprinopsis marcescibilis]|uniref:DNA replication regulator SLD2 n=1 Tax=Coprinopsis marcescibilis TaxID=230819 RepID=A0A5C3LQ24_COPMA|nr:hypothetical protein FA15DRAFT_651313 [Coprinopsis marcescibilis]